MAGGTGQSERVGCVVLAVCWAVRVAIGALVVVTMFAAIELLAEGWGGRP